MRTIFAAGRAAGRCASGGAPQGAASQAAAAAVTRLQQRWARDAVPMLPAVRGMRTAAFRSVESGGSPKGRRTLVASSQPPQQQQPQQPLRAGPEPIARSTGGFRSADTGSGGGATSALRRAVLTAAGGLLLAAGAWPGPADARPAFPFTQTVPAVPATLEDKVI